MKIVNNLHGKYTNNIAHFYGVPYAYTNKDNVFKNKKLNYNYINKFHNSNTIGNYKIVEGGINTINSFEQRFKELAIKWENETGVFSTTSPKINNNAFHDLLRLGKGIIPLILKHLQHGGTAQWHIVLNAITKINPVPPEDASKSKKIKEAWIIWGKSNFYI